MLNEKEDIGRSKSYESDGKHYKECSNIGTEKTVSLKDILSNPSVDKGALRIAPRPQPSSQKISSQMPSDLPFLFTLSNDVCANNAMESKNNGP